MDSPERKAAKRTLNSRKINVFARSPCMTRKLVSGVVGMLAKCLAGPDSGGDAVGHVLAETVGCGVAEVAFGERVNGDAFRCDVIRKQI